MKTTNLLAFISFAICVHTGCVPDAEPIELDAQIVSQSGRWTGAERCHVLVEPASRWGLNCRVVVDCPDVALWGGKRMGGYANCEVEDRRFTRGENGESLWRMWMRFDEDRLTLSHMDDPGRSLVLDLRP